MRNKIRILIVGLAAISAASLSVAVAAAPPLPVTTEKVITFDAVVDHLPAFDIALCDIEALEVQMTIEREAVNHAVPEPSIAGRSAVTHAKVSAHGRMCGRSAHALPRSKPLTDYGQRW